MKKGISWLLVLCLCMGLMIPVFADQENSDLVAQLILTAKEKLSISDDEFVFTAYYQSETKSGKRYDLNWESKDETKSSSINVEIGETGTIYRYRLYDSAKETGEPKYPARTEEEALAAAKSYFAVIDPEKAGQVFKEEITYSAYDKTYEYRAQRIHNGIAVFGNDVTIQVDADSLQLIYYYISWEEKLIFEDAQLLSFDQAKTAYEEKLGYELFYQVVSEDYKDTVKLVYRPKFDQTVYIDAVTGEAIDFETIYEAERESASGGSASKDQVANAAATLSPEEQAMVDEIAQMLSKEKAEQIARNVPEIGITDDYTIDSYHIFKDSHGKYTGRITFSTKNEPEEEYGYRNVSIDVKTGEITAFNGYHYLPAKAGENEEIPELSYDESRQIAEIFLNKYYAEKFSQMEAKNIFHPQSGSVAYQRVENGIKVYNNGASFYIDAATKEISSFSLEWTEESFPQAEAAEISDVYSKILTEDNFVCGYLTVPADEGKTVKAVPVYRVENEAVLDAQTLEELDWRLRPVEEYQKPEYTDIANHYVKEYAEKLLVMGIYYPSNELRPDDAVTQKEYLQLISQVVFHNSYLDSDDVFYNDLIRRGVLTKEDVRPDSPITRIEGIRYLLNALGYKEFANIPGIFNCPFADVNETDKGYGAIAAGLHLVNSETDIFYADSNLKRGDSLIIIYNYLNR